MSVDPAFAAAQEAVDRAGKWKPIVRSVCAQHGLAVEEALSPLRSLPYTRCRQEIYFRLSEAGMSLSAIGRVLKLDHTTVRHGIETYAKRNGVTRPIGAITHAEQWSSAFATGLNTHEIARKFDVREGEVVRTLHRRREARFRAKIQ